jgi:radical SAM superfamily enzyme with C-terminal helix-hairpin-helix motif
MIISGSGASLNRVTIIDGYVDEPTCLGVPPYISPYPRYIAGAIWAHSPRTEVGYETIDQVRSGFSQAVGRWSKSDMLVLIAGMIVPGKYIGGTPISVREAKELFSAPALSDIPKLLVGPWARFGCGVEGGRLALSTEVLSPPFDHIIIGDPEVVIGNLAQSGWRISDADWDALRGSPREIEGFARRGAEIVKLHPHHSWNHLICEIETYRGCPRFLTGGCSFCVEPSYGEPQPRNPKDVAMEIAVLHECGVMAFRIGNQADFFTYGSTEIGEEEFPTPDPAFLEKFLSGVRKAAPHLEVLHIDNVNPGTIARHPEESRHVVKAIIKYHTPGDVAAFGVESLDPEVIRRNNLKADSEEVHLAVRILNEVGGIREDNGLPHLLPGINLLYGLPGESKRTLDANMEFLQRLLTDRLMVRRINIRQVIGFSGTRLELGFRSKIKRNEFYRHKEQIRRTVDLEMIRRVAPHGTVLRNAFVEVEEGNSYLLRQLGTYPLLCQMPTGSDRHTRTDVMVVDHGPRSLTVLPYPFRPHYASLAQWRAVPGIGAKRAARIKGTPDIASLKELAEVLGTDLPSWFSEALNFDKE